MRWFLVCLGLGGALGAQASLHILAVERPGLPPYEVGDRVYRLDGGQDQGLRVGDRLLVKRPGEVRAFGHLWVTEVRRDRAGARYGPMEKAYPMKGDLAILEVLKGLPDVGRLNLEPLPVVLSPASTAPPPPRNNGGNNTYKPAPERHTSPPPHPQNNPPKPENKGEHNKGR